MHNAMGRGHMIYQEVKIQFWAYAPTGGCSSRNYLFREMLVSSGYSDASIVCCDLDVDIGGVRIIDSITWDVHSTVSPWEFSTRMCAELGVGSMFVQPMAQSISQQLTEYKHKVPGWAWKGTVAPATEDMKVVLIDVRFRSVIYRDRLQWDINCLHNSPEWFARSTVADLNLPQEMEPIIALTIHQQTSNQHETASSPVSRLDECQAEDVEGPCISSIHPVDQFEFNTHNWKLNRPASY